MPIHSDALPIYNVDDYAYTILAQKISAVAGVSQVLVFGQKPFAVHVQVNPAALAARGIGSRRCAMRWPRPPSTGRRAISRPSTRRSRSTPTTRSSMPRGFATSSSPGATARRSGCSDIADVIDGMQGRRAPAPGSRASAAEVLAIQREPGANTDRGRRQRSRRDAAAARLGAAVGACRSGVGPLASDPRRRASTCSSR